MLRISVVIITKNEAENIVACIASAKKLTNNIIVVDSGSEDATISLAEKTGAQVVSIGWKGYGHARNIGARLSLHDWVFSLDADERLTDELAACIKNIATAHIYHVYGFRRTNFFNDAQLRYGSLGHERVFRLYNRHFTQWNDEPVHEKLVLKKNAVIIKLSAALLHFGIRDLDYYEQKKMNYAYLCALKYLRHGRKLPGFFRLLSPAFHFVQSFIFRLGFLDGRGGYITARINAAYTFKKYDHLYRLMRNKNVVPAPGYDAGVTSPQCFADIIHAE